MSGKENTASSVVTRSTTAQTNAQKTTAPIAPGETGAILPEFGRLQDVQRMFGLKRGFCYQLINAGQIKSVSLRKPGSKFGCRLIHLQSVRDFLTAHMDGKASAA